MTTELYKVLFDYETDKDDELAVKQGDTIRVTSKESPEWWSAETLNSNASGLVPSNFIEKIKTDEGHLAMVIQDYTAQSSDELTLQTNGIVTVLDQHVAEGWWKGDLNGKKGVFPASHVQLLEDDLEEDGKSKNNFKLAAYGVKQGGIGSILAGGLSLKRSSTVGGHRTSMQEKRTSIHSQASEPQVPAKPHPIKTDSTTPASSVKALSSLKAMVIHDYKPENQDEIQLMRGEYVTVIDTLDNDGWWKGTSENGATGIFPSNFVQVVNDEKPTRPVRARPATIKTDTTDTMAKPPPVPVGTRPTSLLTQRDTGVSPPRPTTLPPIGPRRPSEKNGHKRIPSIPLMSPDLPPLSPVYDQRPTRPIPRPVSLDVPTSPPSRPLPSTSPEAHMAKPPKVNLANLAGPVAPPRSPSTSRPCSINHETVPPVPKRSMPPVPEKKPTETLKKDKNDTKLSVPDDIRQMILMETEKIRVEFEAKLEEERIQRIKLQTELEELRAILH